MISKTKICATILIIACMIFFIISALILVRNLKEGKKSNELTQELIEDVIEENPTTKENADFAQVEKAFLVDWNKLKNINKDIIGWIQIDGTNINYPILNDNTTYYLKHSYNRQYNSNGSIFTMNKNPFEVKITIINGHNMRNGLMFSELSNYLDENFFYSHQNFRIYTPENNYTATIFSSYSIGVTDEENNIKNLSFDEEIAYYKNKSKYKIGVNNINKIVKLSTCSYVNNKSIPTNQRCYILAKIEEID